MGILPGSAGDVNTAQGLFLISANGTGNQSPSTLDQNDQDAVSQVYKGSVLPAPAAGQASAWTDPNSPLGKVFGGSAAGGGLAGLAGMLGGFFSKLTGIAGPFNSIQSVINAVQQVPLVQDLQNLIDSIFQGITQTGLIGNKLSDLITALKNISPANILGVGGPADIGQAVQQTWNQWIAGLVGADTSDDASLADLFNIGQLISKWASNGRDSFDILGIRANKSLDNGFLPTSESPFSLSSVAFGSALPTFAVTQAASTFLFHRWSESGAFGAVAWQGSGTANLTQIVIVIWKMDTTTGEITAVHTSPNIIGDVVPSGTPGPNVYEFVTAGITRQATDVFGAEITVVGTGTHTVMGQMSALGDQPVFPRRWAATRNSGGVAPPATLANGEFTYTGETPFIEFAVEAGTVPVPHAPQPVTFSAAGPAPSTVVPSFADVIDIIPVGAGGAGGSAVTFIDGQGATAGVWAPVSLIVGVDVAAGSIINATVGAGGTIDSSGNPSDGTATTVTYTDPGGTLHTITAAGGLRGANGGSAGGGNVPGNTNGVVGSSPGNVTVNGVLYRGGGTATFVSGSAPGGGGSGSLPWVEGYPGADGALTIVARQN